MSKNTFVIHKNRGMLLEQLLNKTIEYYNKNNIAFFAKKNLDIKFSKVFVDNKNKKLESSFISKKSTVDYYGVYKGQYITFEAKSTQENVFHFSNIKKHQHNHLKQIHFLGGKAFYIIFFKKHSKIFLINVDKLDYENLKSISIEIACQRGKLIDIDFPGIIDFLKFIE